MADPTNLQAATWYARHGFAVFPCHTIRDGKCSCGIAECGSPGKHPVGDLCPNGVKQASRFAGTVTAWWNRMPGANIAIACGKPSMGLVVVDVDPQHGGDETFTELVALHGPFPETPQVLTGGGGRHLYFHSDAPIPNKVGLFPGIDLRGDGGYVVAPRSLHISGRQYEWELSARPESVPIAQLPAWIEEALAAVRVADTGPRVDPIAVFSGIPAGERHDQLYRYACRLRTQDRMSQVEAVALVRTAMLTTNPPYTDETPENMVADVWGRYTAGGTQPVREPRGMVEALVDEEPSAPVVIAEDRSVRCEWVSRGIVATAKTLKEHTDGRIGGHLTVESTLPGVARVLRSAQFTFTALRSRTELVNDLKKKLDGAPWDTMIEELCGHVTRYVQAGDPGEVIDPNRPVAPVEFVVWPLVLYKHPTILFGDPGTTKSYIAALLTYLVALGTQQSVVDLEVRRKLANPLYLDWEGDVDSLAARLASLRVGMELPPVSIAYRRCSRSLAADLDRIKSEIALRGSEFVIVDSLGPACGAASLMDPEAANEFFAALRSLNVSSLILGHNAKNAGNGPRSVFGSMFFGALARSIWEVRREQEEDTDTIEVGLFHSKMNYGRRERPIGFHFHFGPGATLVTPHSPKDIAAASGMQPLSTRILRLLRESGKMSVGEIAEQLGAAQETVRVTLYKLRDKHPPVVDRFDRMKWAAITQEEAKEEMPWQRL